MPLDDTRLFTRVTRIRVGDRLYPIDSYEQASGMFRAALEAWTGDEDDVPNPVLCDDDGHALGYVSRNGRCWIGRVEDSHATCVYAP